MKQPKLYSVARLPEPLTIDGDWNKPAWQRIRPLVVDLHMGQEPEHRPRVMAKLCWDVTSLYFIFRVEDRYVRAIAQRYQDPVCRDSCVEFFFTPGSHLGLSYFNLEINCGGTMLFWWNPEGGNPVPVAHEDGGQLEIGHSLPKIIDPENAAPTTWTLECRLPFKVIEKYCRDAGHPAPGVLWKANFYKCADRTSHPHWLTWSHVDHPTPKFHLPKFFGTLRFE